MLTSEQLKNFFETGFHVGSIEELTDNSEWFNATCDTFINFPDYEPSHWDCFYPIVNFHNNPELPPIIPLQDVPERDMFVRKNNLQWHQKWYRLISNPELLQEKKDNLRFLVDRFLRNDVYSHIFTTENLKKGWSINFNDNITMYDDKGCYICKHQDGGEAKNHSASGKIAAVIVYLTNKEEWSEKNGGEFVCTANNFENTEPISKKIPPVRGTYVMLDFTKNNVWHEVLPVRHGFKRWSYLAFTRLTCPEGYINFEGEALDVSGNPI